MQKLKMSSRGLAQEENGCHGKGQEAPRILKARDPGDTKKKMSSERRGKRTRPRNVCCNQSPRGREMPGEDGFIQTRENGRPSWEQDKICKRAGRTRSAQESTHNERKTRRKGNHVKSREKAGSGCTDRRKTNSQQKEKERELLSQKKGKEFRPADLNVSKLCCDGLGEAGWRRNRRGLNSEVSSINPGGKGWSHYEWESESPEKNRRFPSLGTRTSDSQQERMG